MHYFAIFHDQLFTAHPFFTWHESQGNTIPTMRVHYGINDTDRISLYPHDAMPDVEDHKKPLCNYLGRLEHDSRATVAVTGCQGTGETEITLLSSRSMGSYLFNDSNVSMIEIRLEYALNMWNTLGGGDTSGSTSW